MTTHGPAGTSAHFRGFMHGHSTGCLTRPAPPPETASFPIPANPRPRPIIQARGGVDCCFGGIGINGHVAFNEPPEPGEEICSEAFAALPSRVLSLAARNADDQRRDRRRRDLDYSRAAR